MLTVDNCEQRNSSPMRCVGQTLQILLFSCNLDPLRSPIVSHLLDQLIILDVGQLFTPLEQLLLSSKLSSSLCKVLAISHYQRQTAFHCSRQTVYYRAREQLHYSGEEVAVV